MTPSRGLMLKVYGSSVARSSPLPAASMTTGTSTTESWPKNAGPPCSSGRIGSTATDGRWTAEHTRLRRGACIRGKVDRIRDRIKVLTSTWMRPKSGEISPSLTSLGGLRTVRAPATSSKWQSGPSKVRGCLQLPLHQQLIFECSDMGLRVKSSSKVGMSHRFRTETTDWRRSASFKESLIARAAVGIPTPQNGPDMTGAMPPTVLTPNEYPRMSEMKVPVTRNFYYRPTWLADRPTPKPGWDVVWIERRRDHARRKGLVASIVDAWFPGHFLRVVHDYLGGDSKPLQDPPSSRLLGGRLAFTAPDDEYENLDRLLLVSRLDATVRGRHFEQAEIWSERRVLLAIVRIERLGTFPSEDRDLMSDAVGPQELMLDG